MEINWIVVGWIIDMTLNGLAWLVIAALSLILIDMTDTWTRKVIKWMDKADKWTRKLIDILYKKGINSYKSAGSNDPAI